MALWVNVSPGEGAAVALNTKGDVGSWLVETAYGTGHEVCVGGMPVDVAPVAVIPRLAPSRFMLGVVDGVDAPLRVPCAEPEVGVE
jgi:hypothetical protein